ncbi:MAG TPA: dienelactone hydrolase family protein [Acidimicrobiia bacterium]|nr:dienelactone hydrolase family protein [Acidimicrobiia bacterium]
MPDLAIAAESVTIAGANGDEIEAYFARPTGAGASPGVVVIHHMPGFDRASKEITRTFAAYGYSALCPNLHHRYAPGAKATEAAAAAMEAGGVPDDQCIGDIGGAVAFLRTLPNANGKVGVIGYCSGGRQAYVVACSLDIDAAVDCYGGRVVATPDDLTPARPISPVDRTPDLRCPLLGLFGAEDSNPSPEQVTQIEAALRAHGKTYEFYTFENAGHAFFAVDRPNYRVDAAREGWKIIWDFFGRYLAA